MKKNVSKKKENDKRSINVFTSQDLLHYTRSLKSSLWVIFDFGSFVILGHF